MDKEKLKKHLKEIEKITDPEERFLKNKENYTELDTLGVSSDILPYGQKWAVVSFVSSDPTLNELFYSFSFNMFIKQAKSMIRKTILGGDKIIDKKMCNIIFKEMSKFKAEEEIRRKKEKEEYNKSLNEVKEDIKKRKAEYSKILSNMEAGAQYDKCKKEFSHKMKLHMERLDIREKKYKEELNRTADRRKDLLFEKIHKRIDSLKMIKHEKDTNYIVSYFKEFLNINRIVLDEKFRKKYGHDYDMYGLVKIWGVFKTLTAAQKFSRTNKNNLKFGKSFIQPMGKWNIINPPKAIIENTEFMNEKTEELIAGQKENRRRAKDEFKFRKEVLKEYEARKQGIKYKAYKRSKDDVGTHKYKDHLGRVRHGPSKIKKVKKEDEILKSNIPDDILERGFEFFNQKDRYQLKMSNKKEQKDHAIALSRAREVIKNEIHTGKASSLINPEMMKKLKMDKSLTDIVEKKAMERRNENREKSINEEIKRRERMKAETKIKTPLEKKYPKAIDKKESELKKK
jgi:hypothetical protein